MADKHYILYGLPFANVAENIMLDDQQNNNGNNNLLNFTNNDMLANIDPDIINMSPNCLKISHANIMIHLLNLTKQLNMTTLSLFYIQAYVAQLIN